LAKRNKTAYPLESSSATVGYEAQHWQMVEALRGSMDAAEYTVNGADPEAPDEYRSRSIFWVPPEARWHHLKAQAQAHQPTIGQLVDDAMASGATTRRSRACRRQTTPVSPSTRRRSLP
jgi:type I restriction enzyme M protein